MGEIRVEDSAMEELYRIKEVNSLRHIAMSTKDIQNELKRSVKEFNLIVSKKRIEKDVVNS